MMNGLRRASLVLALASVALVPRAASAQQPAGVEEGRTRFTRGIDLYKEGNFHAALAEFRAAYAAAPSYRFHYNLGQTLYQLQDYAGAVRAFEQYLAEGGDKVDAERRKEVEADLAKLRPRVAQLTFVVNVPGAEVSIDEEPHGKVQKQPLLVSAGRRRISMTASGYQTETRVLDVAGTQKLDLTFELKPIGGAAAAPTDRTAPTSGPTRSKSRGPFYIGLVATGALGAGTAVMAIVASSKHSAYERALDVPNNAKGIADARTSTRTTALVADILGGATALAAGLTIVAFAVTSGEEPLTAAITPPPKPVLRAVVGPSAVGVVGTF
jgi:tetratricopeptide (TPR) repeat protein